MNSNKHKQAIEKPKKHKREASCSLTPSPSPSPPHSRNSSSSPRASKARIKAVKKKVKEKSPSPVSSDDDRKETKKKNLKKRKKVSSSPESPSPHRLRSTSSPHPRYSRHSPPPFRRSSPPSHYPPPYSHRERYYQSSHYDRYQQPNRYEYPSYSRNYRRHSPPPIISASLSEEQINNSKKMFLGNLPYDITESRLINDIINELRIDHDDKEESRQPFSSHITQIEFCTNERTGRRKGHVFITYDTHQNAVRFMKSVTRDGGFQCDGRTLKVDWGVDQGEEGKVRVITEGGEGKIRVVEKVVPYLGVWRGGDGDRRRGREEDRAGGN